MGSFLHPDLCVLKIALELARLFTGDYPVAVRFRYQRFCRPLGPHGLANGMVAFQFPESCCLA